MPAKSSDPKKLTVNQIKELLAQEEVSDVKLKLERAQTSLEDINRVLSDAIFHHDGYLSTGNIDYAAFRIETLSLIFEVASRNFNKSAKSGASAYEDFLSDLGDEVGFTFAWDLIKRIKENNIVGHVLKFTTLLELWALFENDTGAGITSINKCTKNEIVIKLSNNPLRKMESKLHSHCGFYRHYISTLINELHSSWVRLIAGETDFGVSGHPLKAYTVVETPDIDGNCIFVAKLREEKLTKTFDELYEVVFEHQNHSEDANHLGCVTAARKALERAQKEFFGLDDQQSPKELYKALKGNIAKKDFDRMRDLYHSASRHLHGTGETQKISKTTSFEILRDVRRTVYAIEFLDMSDQKKIEAVQAIKVNEYMNLAEQVLQGMTDLPDKKREEVRNLIKNLKNQKGVMEEELLRRTIDSFRAIGGKLWEVARPIFTEIASAAIKKQFDLT